MMSAAGRHEIRRDEHVIETPGLDQLRKVGTCQMTLFKQIIIPEDPSDEPIHEDLLIGHNNATLEMTGDELHVMADGDDCLAIAVTCSIIPVSTIQIRD